MERLERKVDNLDSTVDSHETRIILLEKAVEEIRSKLRDLEHPPRWVQTGLLLALVLKEIVWPLIQVAMR